MSERGQKSSKYVILLLVFTGLAGTAMAFRQMLQEAKAIVATTGLRVFGQLPEFALTRETSEPLSLSSLSGRVWIADFIFTRCAGPCPRMTQRMAQLQTELGDLPSVRFVSFSVDPDYDMPGVLQEYGKVFGAEPDRWSFVTGDRTKIYDLSINGFRLALGEDPTDETLLIHSTKFVLVDQEGRIRGYYDEQEPEQMSKLATDVRRLVRWPGR